MQALEAKLKTLLNTRKPRPIGKETLDELVSQTLSETQTKVSAETRKTQWEYLLRNEILQLAATEGKALKDAHTEYYDGLSFRLDLVLTFTEHDACEAIVPYNILQDLLETQTIPSCSHVFSWIEERADRLTENMVPQKGKALVLLRTLNDLLRRLSKTGSTTIFCGRILTFLSRVFPLGERSGVNLRGEYGLVWDGPGSKGRDLQKDGPKDEAKMEVDDTKEAGREDKMDVDVELSDAEKKRQQKEEFYYTFWSLQVPFSRPPAFADPATYPAFKDAVNKILPVIKEAATKERALMGSKTILGGGSGSTLRVKRDSEVVEDNAAKDYFFAKYLTSPDLLDLEIADPHFRRQFLFQLLIVLQHILTFTKSAKATWLTARNRSLQIDFTAEPAEAQWVQETMIKATEELRQTSPNGHSFAETVKVILEREKNWIRWKNELCAPFDREPWAEEIEDENGLKRKISLEEATKEIRKKMRVDPPEWEHKLGSGPLTEIWELGYRDLNDLKHPFQPGDVKDFVKKVKQEDARSEMRRKQLLKNAERLAQARAKAAAPPKESLPTPAPTVPIASHVVEVASPPVPPRATAASPPTPLHPSLPAKPGTAPLPQPTSSQENLAIVAPKRISTPAPASSPVTAPVAVPAPVAPSAEPASIIIPPDDQIQKYEESKQRWSWLALRTARDQYLQHFGKIGTGDIVLLAQEIEKEEKERKEREKATMNEEPTPANAFAAGSATGTGDDRGVSPMVPAASAGAPASEDSKGEAVSQTAMLPELPIQNGDDIPKESEADVKMEER